MNSIATINITRDGSVWVFDDPSRDLTREPFIAGIPEIIDNWLQQEGKLENALQNGVQVTASPHKFPGANHSIQRLHPEAGGTWYKDTNSEREGWLCPALFKYFDPAPERLWVKFA